MVFQQNVGSATKNKSKKAMQSPKPSMFKLNSNDDDSEDMDSDDCAESSDKEMDSDDVQEPPKTSIKKTPQAKTPSKQTPSKLTPGKQNLAKPTPGKQNLAKPTPGKQNLAKQTPGKQTPGKQTPNKRNSLVPDKKVSFELSSAKTPTATDSQVGKRQATPASKGKQGVQEFKGLKAGLKNKSETSLKMEEEEDSDEEDDCDEEDDSKQNVLKSKLKQKIANNQNKEEDDDEEEEEDDDDEEEEEEEEEEDDDEDDDEDDKVEEDEEEEEKDDSKQNALKNNSKQLKKDSSTPTKIDASIKNLAIMQKNKEAEDLRDVKQLVIRNLPIDVTHEEIKSLSDDIINVALPDPAAIKSRNFKTVYSFVTFDNEEKAEKNYAAFQNQTLRGVSIECGYTGVKSKFLRTKNADAIYDSKKLHIFGLPKDVKVMQIAKLTPSATSIFLTASPASRSAFVNFDSEEAAAEAFDANKEVKIDGFPLTVMYALDKRANEQRLKRAFQQGGQPPFAKRPRQDLDVSSQDY